MGALFDVPESEEVVRERRAAYRQFLIGYNERLREVRRKRLNDEREAEKDLIFYRVTY